MWPRVEFRERVQTREDDGENEKPSASSRRQFLELNNIPWLRPRGVTDFIRKSPEERNQQRQRNLITHRIGLRPQTICRKCPERITWQTMRR